MAATITKLLLIRKIEMRADLLDRMEARGFTSDPIKVRPSSTSAGWNDESDITHYAFELKGMKLTDYKKIRQFCDDHGIALHEIEEGATVADTLKKYGLQVHETAE